MRDVVLYLCVLSLRHFNKDNISVLFLVAGGRVSPNTGHSVALYLPPLPLQFTLMVLLWLPVLGLNVVTGCLGIRPMTHRCYCLHRDDALPSGHCCMGSKLVWLLLCQDGLRV